jgi:hypothetical protein
VISAKTESWISIQVNSRPSSRIAGNDHHIQMPIFCFDILSTYLIHECSCLAALISCFTHNSSFYILIFRRIKKKQRTKILASFFNIYPCAYLIITQIEQLHIYINYTHKFSTLERICQFCTFNSISNEFSHKNLHLYTHRDLQRILI